MIRAPLRPTAQTDSALADMVTPIAFNPRSEALLAEVNPLLAALMRRVEARMPDAFEITEGMRSPDRQRRLVAEGKSQTLNSRHLSGNAVDIAAMGPDGQITWDFDAYGPIAAVAKEEASAMGIPDFVWGGDWRTLRDGVHFQIGGPPAPATGQGTASGGLSFGNVQPTQAGLETMFGPEGLSMGMPLGEALLARTRSRRPEISATDPRQAEMDRRRALADLIRT